MKLIEQHTGTVIAERSLKRNTGDKQVLKDKSNTEIVGPFTLDPVHARVGVTVGTTLARNYHSAHVSVTINIPVSANPQGLKDGFDYAFEKANKVLNKHLAEANDALDDLASARR